MGWYKTFEYTQRIRLTPRQKDSVIEALLCAADLAACGRQYFISEALEALAITPHNPVWNKVCLLAPRKMIGNYPDWNAANCVEAAYRLLVGERAPLPWPELALQRACVGPCEEFLDIEQIVDVVAQGRQPGTLLWHWLVLLKVDTGNVGAAYVRALVHSNDKVVDNTKVVKGPDIASCLEAVPTAMRDRLRVMLPVSHSLNR